MRIEDLKKVSLGHYPTPLEKMKNLSKNLGMGELFIKRDDTTGPAIGGNKTRKLEYLLQEAIESGCTAVLTYGGTQTNHGRTTVGAAIKLGLKPILILKGEDPGYLSGNLTLDALMGADLYFVSEENDQEMAANEVIKEYERAGDKVYVVPMGGSNYLGAVGYIMSVKEIMKQMEDQVLTIDHVVCTVGSMGTYAGMLIGAKYFDAPFDVIGIPVMPEEKDAEVLEYANEICSYFELDIRITEYDIKIAYGPANAPYAGEAYNQPDPITRDAIMMLAKSEAIMLDPTYTGKTFRGFVDLIQAGDWIKPHENAMFLHTGGTVALWTKEHLDDMQKQLRDNCRTSAWCCEQSKL
ncbi:D-cysteine desulfhydrase [Gottschalkiaceae bacterium SANA]|nr:D-cysteine desulfhydrase [Gottschalkiaceae bacterium SANA]